MLLHTAKPCPIWRISGHSYPRALTGSQRARPYVAIELYAISGLISPEDRQADQPGNIVVRLDLYSSRIYARTDS